MIRAASNPSSTAGATHGGFTRYLAGSATCKTAATKIASATGHQCSPCAARTGATGRASDGLRPGAMPLTSSNSGFSQVAGDWTLGGLTTVFTT